MKLRSGCEIQYKPYEPVARSRFKSGCLTRNSTTSCGRKQDIVDITELPLPLHDALKEELLKFKNLFSPYKDHISDLVNIIVSAKSINARFAIREKITDIIQEDNNEYMANVGSLTWLTIGVGEIYRDNNITPIYRDIIEKNIKSFSTEILRGGEF